jgi:lambda repressor-like predicted transcriptional regulator
LAIREDIRSMIIKTGWTLKQVNNELNKRHNTNYTAQNLSNKLSRGSIRYKEVLEIADIIGIEIVWIIKK